MQRQKKTASIKEALRAKAGIAIEPTAAIAFDQAAVDAGRKPLSSRRQNLPQLEAKASELYAVPAGGVAALLPIEASFKFSGHSSDEELHYLHVEPLLEQAMQLLERCAMVRAQHEHLLTEKWRLQLEFDRFFRLDRIHQRERQAGADTLPYERAVMEASAERSMEENHAHAETQLKALLEDLLSTGFNKRMAARELTAWLSSYPLKDSELGGDEALYSFDGARKSKSDHLFDAARAETDESAWEQTFSLMHQRYLAFAEAEAGRARKQSAMQLANYSLAEISFRGEKGKVARDAMWEKVFQSQADGGVLNPHQKLAALDQAFAADFRDALARLNAANQGMKLLFGYEADLPKEGSTGYFDNVMQWARQARNWTAHFGQNDQRYTLAVSLKDLAPSQWEAGKAASEWTFGLPDSLFPGQSHVRLRGLKLQVVGGKTDDAEPAKAKAVAQKANPAPEPPRSPGFWSARISVPAIAGILDANGSRKELDQKNLPVCFLGSVSDREGELAGSGALHNASPLGNGWKLALSAKSTGGTQTTALQDILLFLDVAVRSQKVGA